MEFGKRGDLKVSNGVIANLIKPYKKANTIPISTLRGNLVLDSEDNPYDEHGNPINCKLDYRLIFKVSDRAVLLHVHKQVLQGVSLVFNRIIKTSKTDIILVTLYTEEELEIFETLITLIYSEKQSIMCFDTWRKLFQLFHLCDRYKIFNLLSFDLRLKGKRNISDFLTLIEEFTVDGNFLREIVINCLFKSTDIQKWKDEVLLRILGMNLSNMNFLQNFKKKYLSMLDEAFRRQLRFRLAYNEYIGIFVAKLILNNEFTEENSNLDSWIDFSYKMVYDIMKFVSDYHIPRNIKSTCSMDTEDLIEISWIIMEFKIYLSRDMHSERRKNIKKWSDVFIYRDFMNYLDTIAKENEAKVLNDLLSRRSYRCLSFFFGKLSMDDNEDTIQTHKKNIRLPKKISDLKRLVEILKDNEVQAHLHEEKNELLDEIEKIIRKLEK